MGKDGTKLGEGNEDGESRFVSECEHLEGEKWWVRG